MEYNLSAGYIYDKKEILEKCDKYKKFGFEFEKWESLRNILKDIFLENNIHCKNQFMSLKTLAVLIFNMCGICWPIVEIQRIMCDNLKIPTTFVEDDLVFLVSLNQRMGQVVLRTSLKTDHRLED